jgi:hypothetical protein
MFGLRFPKQGPFCAAVWQLDASSCPAVWLPTLIICSGPMPVLLSCTQSLLQISVFGLACEQRSAALSCARTPRVCRSCGADVAVAATCLSARAVRTWPEDV